MMRYAVPAGGYPPELSESIICSCLPKTFLPIVDRSSAIVVESWGPIQLPLFCQVNKESEWWKKNIQISNKVLCQLYSIAKTKNEEEVLNAQLQKFPIPKYFESFRTSLVCSTKKKTPTKNTCSDCFKKFVKACASVNSE